MKRYRFTASHRLYSAELSDEENRAIYGKCANPFGHGHDYYVELTVRGRVDATTGRAADLFALDKLAGEQISEPFGYQDLNGLEEFRHAVPTTENLAREVDIRLRRVWPGVFGAGGPALEKVRIWETPRNICEVTES